MRDLSPIQVAELVWRRRGWVVAAIAFGLVAAAVVLQVMSPIYRASTQILVESPRVPAEYVRTTVTTNLRESLQTIEQQMTNRDNLERIIAELDLHSDLIAAGLQEQALARMRRSLEVEVRGNRIFTLYFSASEPRVAADAANRIAELFIQQNLRLRELQAEGTSSFLQSELEEIKRQLEQQEAQVTRFTVEHAGSLPTQRESNLAAIANLRTRLDMNLEAIENVQMRKILLERELRLAQEGAPSVVVPGAHIRELEIELARLESVFTDRHPDVVRLKNEIEALRRRPEAEEAVESSPMPEDLELRGHLEALDLDLERLKAERGRALVTIDGYQRKLEETPRVEQELLILTRDYENIKDAHQSLLSKRLDARLAENMERQRQSEQFTILERALPPKRPHSPNVQLVLVLGAALGSLLGFVLAYLRDEIDTTFRDFDALQEAFPDVNVIAALPYVKPELGSSRRRAAAGSAR